MNVGRVKSGKSIAQATGGFTLVELLVAVCVIAILCAVLFPVFVKAKETAKVSECLSNMRQIGAGMHMYLDDYSGRFPAAVSYGSPSYWDSRDRKTLQVLLSRYVSRGLATEVVKGRKVYTGAGVFACPSDTAADARQGGTYGIAAGMPVWKSTGSSYIYYASNQEDWERHGLAIPWTSLSPLIATSTGKRMVGAAISDIPYPTRKAVVGDLHYWHYGDKTPDNHLAFCNTLFADGHAARVKGSEHMAARMERLKPWHNATEIAPE